MPGAKPAWLTFDCYGTLIQWDEGLGAVIEAILAKRGARGVETRTVLEAYDRHEHALERTPPHRSFRVVAGESLRLAMAELGLEHAPADIELLTGGISRMPPFPEVVAVLGELRSMGFRLCIVSNTRDLGFRCVWIDRGTGRRPLPDYTPAAVFPDLAPLPAFFRSLGWG